MHTETEQYPTRTQSFPAGKHHDAKAFVDPMSYRKDLPSGKTHSTQTDRRTTQAELVDASNSVAPNLDHVGRSGKRLPWTKPARCSVFVLCARVAARNLGWSAFLAVAGAFHALAHGALAWTAAALGRSMAYGDAALPFLQVSTVAMAFVGVSSAVVKGVSGVLASQAQSRLSSYAGQCLRDSTVRALLLAGTNTPSPTTIARLVSRLREAENAVEKGPFAVARAIAQLVPIAAGLVLLSPTLALLAATTLAPFSIGLTAARKRWRRYHETYMRTADLVHEEMDDMVRHLDLWRVSGSGDRVGRLLNRLGYQLASTHVRAETIGVAISSANEVLGAAALLAVLALTSSGYAEVDGASLIAFAALFFLAYRPLRDIGDARTAWLRGTEALRTLDGLAIAVDDEPFARTGADANLAESTGWETADASVIRAPWVTRDVRGSAGTDSNADSITSKTQPEPSSSRFSSQTGPHHLPLVTVESLAVPERIADVSFEVEPGQMLVVSGPTGSGKTSLLRALLGLEPTATGNVTVDGRTVVPGEVGPSKRPFAWVPQDAPIVSGSLIDNFLVGGADPALANAQLAILGATKLADELGDTKLGAGGRCLSGGERRWVCLARALCTGMPVILLDEPTVGLDADARSAVIDVLRQIKGKRSVVIASHDSNVWELADKVLMCG